MKPESRMRQRVITALRSLDPISVENVAHPGTPDVNCTAGWIELKCADAWPAREHTPLRLPHFTPEQRVWLLRRWRADRRAWLLLRVHNDWLLFTGEAAAQHVGRVSRGDLLRVASAHWYPVLDDNRLRVLLSQ